MHQVRSVYKVTWKGTINELTSLAKPSKHFHFFFNFWHQGQLIQCAMWQAVVFVLGDQTQGENHDAVKRV